MTVFYTILSAGSARYFRPSVNGGRLRTWLTLQCLFAVPAGNVLGAEPAWGGEARHGILDGTAVAGQFLEECKSSQATAVAPGAGSEGLYNGPGEEEDYSSATRIL